MRGRIYDHHTPLHPSPSQWKSFCSSHIRFGASLEYPIAAITGMTSSDKEVVSGYPRFVSAFRLARCVAYVEGWAGLGLPGYRAGRAYLLLKQVFRGRP